MPTTTRSRLMFSVFVILAWFGLIAEGAHALYSDTATLAGNTISTGSVDLQVSNSQSASTSTYADSRAGFSFTLNPGESDEKYFFLKNVSTSNTVLDLDVTAGNLAGPSDLTQEAYLEFTPVDGTGAAVGQPIAVAPASMQVKHVGLPVSLEKGANQRFKLKAVMPSDFGGSGESMSFDLVFTGTQHVPSS